MLSIRALMNERTCINTCSSLRWSIPEEFSLWINNRCVRLDAGSKQVLRSRTGYERCDRRRLCFRTGDVAPTNVTVSVSS